MTLLDRLRTLYPEASRRSHKQWIEGGRITVNGLVARDARAPVEAMHDEGTARGPPGGQVVPEESIGRALPLALGGDGEQAGRLVDDEEVGVLVDQPERRGEGNAARRMPG